MKKSFIILAAASLCCLFSCEEKIDDASSISARITITVNAEEGVATPETFTVKLENAVEKYVVEKKVSASETTFMVDELIAGNYSISVVGENAQGRYFIGNAVNVVISQKDTPVSIEVKASKPTGLVLKEIYYSCPPDNETVQRYKDDNFYEIYNNSDSDQLLDGLCLATLQPLTASASMKTIYTFELDGGRNPEDYVYCGVIWQIPSAGGKYILKPGESAVIASVAIDHNSVTTGSVDLSKADFEAYIPVQTLYADHPTIPNIERVFGGENLGGSGAERWLATVAGPAVVIFNPEAPIDNTTWVSPKGEDEKCKEIPVSWVIDAVEAIESPNAITYKRVPTILDAGGINVNYQEMDLSAYGLGKIVTSGYNSNSISRKVKETKADGRIVYQDTNNSSEDFQVNEKAEVRRDNAGIPVWSPAYVAAE